MKPLILKKIVQNKRAYYEYFIEKKIEAGIVLLGWEVKSARFNMVTVDNSYVYFDNKEAYIYNSIFQTNMTQFYNRVYNTDRVRKLLLKKNELLFLREMIKQRGYTIVVLDMYWRNAWVKINIGIAKGKKKYDKRNIIDAHKWKREKTNILKYVK